MRGGLLLLDLGSSRGIREIAGAPGDLAGSGLVSIWEDRESLPIWFLCLVFFLTNPHVRARFQGIL